MKNRNTAFKNRNGGAATKYTKGEKIMFENAMAIQGLKATAIQSLPFYGSLTIEQKELLMDQSEIRTYKKGEEITCLMSPCVGPFLILEGGSAGGARRRRE